MFISVGFGFLRYGKWFQVRVPLPALAVPLCWLRLSAVGADLQAQVVEWIGAERFRCLVLVCDAVDVNAEKPVAARNALDDLIADPATRLNLPSRAAISPEHWTRIKALSRRFAELGTTEYDYLRPVADFIARLIEHVTVVISTPLKWVPEDAPEEMKRQVVSEITSEVHAELHALAESRLFHERVKAWSIAYSHRGTGSTRERARDIEAIYEQAAPIPGEMADPRASEFVASVLKVAQAAVERKGGMFE